MKNIIIVATFVVAAANSAVAANGQDATISGRWTQASNGREIVVLPKIKLQPNVGISYGTSLGGSVGYGSMTRTIVVTEPTTMQVRRSMTLSIDDAGRFTWDIVKEHPESIGKSCIKISRIRRSGRVVLEGGTARFAIEGGTEKWDKSCGGSGTAEIAPSDESFDAVLEAGQLILASGPTRWLFSRS
ncbi:hypothetical protein ACMGDM_19895 [Sphingomonas sp. DT-51]|uniref:hypothetical protein n=1 Tax=Sphingomonas sp. DT-51 TaxID=3396165 RepID=UPI003F1C0AEA